MKKFKFFMVLVLLMITISFVTSASAAPHPGKGKGVGKPDELPAISGIAHERIESLGNGVFKIKPTASEIKNYNKKTGKKEVDLDIPENEIVNYNLISTVEEIDEDGNIKIYEYYQPNDNENSFKHSEYFLEDEYSTLGNIGTLNTIDPGEGALRLLRWAQSSLDHGFFFDEKIGYEAALAGERFEKSLNYVMGVFKSNPVIDLFTGLVASDIKNKLKGQGDAYSRSRTAYKEGQVYTNGNWKTYFETDQFEVYWAHEQISFKEGGGTSNSITKNYYPDTYKPIEWVPSTRYNEEQTILNIANDRYKRKLAPTRDSGFQGTFFSNTWNAK